MDKILQMQFLENSLQLYLEVAGTIIIALFIKRIISKYLASLLFSLFTKNAKPHLKKSFLELIIGPLDTFLFLLIIIIALDKLRLPTILQFNIYKASSRSLLDGIANTALILAFIKLCTRFIKYVSLVLEQRADLTADQADNQLVIFFRDFFTVILYIIGALLILSQTFHYDISKLVTGLSIVGAALALATKESLENLIASFIIFFDKPFTTGDLVKVQGFTGNVERIGLRSTRIRTDHKTYITVPNKQMVDTILDNVTLRTQRRAELRLELSLSTELDKLQQIIDGLKAIMNKSPIENSTVFFSETGKNAHVITVLYFTGMQQNIEEFNTFQQQINFEILELLARSGVNLAAASTDITFTRK